MFWGKNSNSKQSKSIKNLHCLSSTFFLPPTSTCVMNSSFKTQKPPVSTYLCITYLTTMPKNENCPHSLFMKHKTPSLGGIGHSVWWITITRQTTIKRCDFREIPEGGWKLNLYLVWWRQSSATLSCQIQTQSCENFWSQCTCSATTTELTKLWEARLISRLMFTRMSITHFQYVMNMLWICWWTGGALGNSVRCKLSRLKKLHIL